MSLEFYIDPYSKKYCFTCPLPDCVTEADPLCPIYQARRRGPAPQYRGHRGDRDRAKAPDGYLTIPQVERRLGISGATIRGWIYRGKLDRAKIRQGKSRVYYIPAELLPEIQELHQETGRS